MIRVPIFSSKIARVFVWSLTIVLSLIVAAAGSIYAIDRHIRRTAEALLRDIRNLHVGESTKDDAQRIVKRYRGRLNSTGQTSTCPEAEAFYEMRIAYDTLNRIAFGSLLWRRIGLRPRGTVAMILIEKGHVCHVSYSVGESAVDGQELMASVGVSFPDPGGFASQRVPYEVLAFSARGTQGIDVHLSPDATAIERQHAFDFDLSCFGSFRGCGAVCELMPSAWLDYQKEARENGWTLMEDEVNDPSCKKLTDSP